MDFAISEPGKDVVLLLSPSLLFKTHGQIYLENK